MPPSERAPSSQFYWKDWLADPAVRAMTFDERGRYMDVLASTHQTARPGICTEEQVRKWACYRENEWASHRAAFAQVFKIRGDKWIQKRTVAERRKQKRRFEQSQRGGRTSARRPRSSLGLLESRLDTGLGTPSSSSSNSSSKRREPTPPFPADPSANSPPTDEKRRVHGAEKGQGPVAIGDLLGKALAGAGAASREQEVAGFADSFLGRMRRMFPGVDVHAIAATVRDESRAGGIHSLEGLVFHRCQQLTMAREGTSPVAQMNSNGPLVPARTEAAPIFAKRVSGADSRDADPLSLPRDEPQEDGAC